MSDLYHCDGASAVIDFVEHTEGALTNPVPVTPREFLASRGPTVLGKQLNASDDPMSVLTL